jgi:E3 ubiquitin-protein ligase TRIP12
MSGMGRVGTMHAWESLGDGVWPDIQAVAKVRTISSNNGHLHTDIDHRCTSQGLGGGYASIGAVLMSARIRNGLQSGISMHGHTYQANPLACAASLAVQHEIAEKDLLGNIRVQGAHMGARLREKLMGENARARSWAFDVRGAGGFW